MDFDPDEHNARLATWMEGGEVGPMPGSALHCEVCAQRLCTLTGHCTPTGEAKILELAFAHASVHEAEVVMALEDDLRRASVITDPGRIAEDADEQEQ